MVKKRVRKSCPWARLTSPLASFRPRPVRVITPMMMPAAAVAITTPRAARAPCSSAAMMSRRLIRVEGWIMAATTARTMP